MRSTGPEHDEHPSISRFRAEHERRGGRGEVVILPDGVHTAALAAAALGCEPGAIANSLLFDADGSPVLVLTSGAHRVDTTKVAATIGVPRLRRASPDFVRTHTGQVIGGVSPLGHPEPVPTYLDPWLERHPVVWAAAGHPAAVFSTTASELVELTGATVVDVE
ncbi:YbaK/EbsC family protein [Nocardioides litoris]|uniref:YbaK/EbsC family protein n=1 Tax=Nocardioides litoris TaxID=1926648 RepID=UPI0011223F85|nr:YbaK/EbsC family protein [Nocardioides litoris]